MDKGKPLLLGRLDSNEFIQYRDLGRLLRAVLALISGDATHLQLWDKYRRLGL
jgi:hypothetical protein